ncbi:MAG: PEP-CTERM sorting domain-containing protein, partial [Verrucomicrobiota bacterium]|nr:PEP-CTERM sorting domain-containing protein [Verrucomicrobiota bacterium]
NTNAYMGIKFNTSTATGLFGWIRIDAGPTAGFPATIVDWAYENSGAGISAGAVPEPTTLALGCLAAGAVGVSVWRKRKKA